MFENSVRSGRFPLLWAGVAVLLAIAILPLDGAVAGSYYASSSYLLLSSPLQPRRQEDCQALSQQFSEAHTQAALAHNECLAKASDEGYVGVESTGTCSKRACQHLHNVTDEILERSTEEARVCQDRLSRYQEQERREEQARRKQEQERQARAAQRDAERNERSAQRAARQAEREAEKLAEQQRREQKEAQRQTGREEQAASQAAAGTPVRVTVSPPPAKAQKPQKPSSSGKGREQEESDYWALVKNAKETADAGRLAVKAIKNPFDTAVGYAANKMNEALLQEGISAATGLPEHQDAGYAGVTAIVDEGRNHVPSTNPFAKQVSSLSLSAVKQVHQGALGEMEQVGKQIEAFEPQPAASGSLFAPSPYPAAARLGNEEPITGIVSDGAGPTGQARSGANPFARAGAETRYTDTGSNASYRIPAGHTLYRDNSGGELRVVRLADVRPTAAAGDRPSAGEQGCSDDGVGVVTPECERKRTESRDSFAASGAIR